MKITIEERVGKTHYPFEISCDLVASVNLMHIPYTVATKLLNSGKLEWSVKHLEFECRDGRIIARWLSETSDFGHNDSVAVLLQEELSSMCKAFMWFEAFLSIREA